jgi:hypothetical protein
MNPRSLAVAAGMALCAGAAQGQFVNADFETGDLIGWTVRNTANGVGAPGGVTMIDIDGPGPLPVSNAAQFEVGQAVFMSGVQEGVEVTQGLDLAQGTLYTFEFDWAVVNGNSGGNIEGGVFNLIINGTPAATQACGLIQPGASTYGHISVNYTPSTSAIYTVGARITRPFILPGGLRQYVDNFRPVAGGGMTGACCLASGACTILSSASCTAVGGIYRGDGSVCATANCPQPPTGACCLPNLTCVITWQGGCTAQGGTYRGDNTVCAGNCPQGWQEQGDAGDTPATAQNINGSGSLPAIVGTITAGDADLYHFRICDAASFGATTVGGAGWDTQLFLFDSTGHGVASDDDDPQGTGLQSRLTSQFVSGAGDYFLGISGYDRDPLGSTTSGEIWADMPFNVERRPDGPAAGEAIGSWGGSPAIGSYTIFLGGSCYLSQVPVCYADCNGDHALNVNDFVCFQSAFAAASPSADCNHDSLLNVNDFVCFQSAFAAGCSQL